MAAKAPRKMRCPHCGKEIAAVEQLHDRPKLQEELLGAVEVYLRSKGRLPDEGLLKPFVVGLDVTDALSPMALGLIEETIQLSDCPVLPDMPLSDALRDDQVKELAALLFAILFKHRRPQG